VDISDNLIEINSTILSALNKPAVLTLYNLQFTNPRILRNGILCPESICVKLNYNGGNLIFNVTGFTYYSAEETPGGETGGGGGSSSGGGGGGGGASGPTVPTASRYFGCVEQDITSQMNINKTAIAFTALIFKLNQKICIITSTVKVIINNSILPSTLDDVYQYLDAGISNVQNKDIISVNIEFRVNNSWLSVNNYDKSTVALFRYESNNWEKLSTSMLYSDSNQAHYTAKADGIGYFAITAGAQQCDYQWDCSVWNGCIDGQQIRRCTNTGSCLSTYQKPIEQKECVQETCFDSIKNFNESDVDCGSRCSFKCTLGQTCNINEDCESNYCLDGTCTLQQTCLDGILNQDEEGIDCGGVCEPCKPLLSPKKTFGSTYLWIFIWAFLILVTIYIEKKRLSKFREKARIASQMKSEQQKTNVENKIQDAKIQLRDYIIMVLDKGHSPDIIKKALIDHKWPSELVEQEMNEVRLQKEKKVNINLVNMKKTP